MKVKRSKVKGAKGEEEPSATPVYSLLLLAGAIHTSIKATGTVLKMRFLILDSKLIVLSDDSNLWQEDVKGTIAIENRRNSSPDCIETTDPHGIYRGSCHSVLSLHSLCRDTHDLPTQFKGSEFRKLNYISFDSYFPSPTATE